MRVLIIIHSFDSGIGLFVSGLLENFKDKNYHFTVVTLSDNKWHVEKSLKQHGVNLIQIPKSKNKIYQAVCRKKEIKRILKTSRWDVIYTHSATVVMFPYLRMAKRYVPNRIMHSHARDFEVKLYRIRKMYHRLVKLLYPYVTTQNLACSEEAAAWMYPKSIIKEKKYQVVPNCIDSEKFKYSEITREKIRNKYKLQNQFVIGHVGRFEKVKNHKFIIDIFEELCRKHSNAKLMLVGDGVLEDDVKRYVAEKKLEHNVLFLGKQSNVNELYQAMDYFILPSEKEGFSMVLLEAQSTGLHCLASNMVPVIVNCIGTVAFKALEDSAKSWAEEIIRDSDYMRIDCSERIKQAGYDVSCMETLFKDIFEKGLL